MKVAYGEQISDETIKLETIGYCHYRRRIQPGSYTQSELRNIINHRNDIIKKYENADKFHIDRLIGLARAEGIFIPVDFDGVLVDADDIFAATYLRDYNLQNVKSKNEEYILWVLFTNDEFVPVLPFVCYQRKTLMERITKKERNDYVEILTKNCRNLKYPICEMEEFQERVNLEHSIRGKVRKQFLLEQIYDALNQLGLFDPQTITCEVGGLTRELLAENGYEFE